MLTLRKAKRWEENSVVLTWGVTAGAPRMAARSCKGTTDVWKPQQRSGERRGCSPGTKRECIHLLLTSSLSAGITACQVRLSIIRWSGVPVTVLCKSFRGLTLPWSPDRRRWVVVAAAVRTS